MNKTNSARKALPRLLVIQSELGSLPIVAHADVFDLVDQPFEASLSPHYEGAWVFKRGQRFEMVGLGAQHQIEVVEPPVSGIETVKFRVAKRRAVSV